MQEYYELKRFLMKEEMAKKFNELKNFAGMTDDELLEYMVTKLHQLYTDKTKGHKVM